MIFGLSACDGSLAGGGDYCGPYRIEQLDSGTDVLCDTEGERLIMLHQGPSDERRDTILPFKIPAQSPAPTAQ